MLFPQAPFGSPIPWGWSSPGSYWGGPVFLMPQAQPASYWRATCRVPRVACTFECVPGNQGVIGVGGVCPLLRPLIIDRYFPKFLGVIILMIFLCIVLLITHRYCAHIQCRLQLQIPQFCIIDFKLYISLREFRLG